MEVRDSEDNLLRNEMNSLCGAWKARMEGLQEMRSGQ